MATNTIEARMLLRTVHAARTSADIGKTKVTGADENVLMQLARETGIQKQNIGTLPHTKNKTRTVVVVIHLDKRGKMHARSARHISQCAE